MPQPSVKKPSDRESDMAEGASGSFELNRPTIVALLYIGSFLAASRRSSA
jgi:hypothetical protein